MSASDIVLWIYGNKLVLFVLVLIFADLLTGLAVAIHPGTPEPFRLGAVADFLRLALYILIGGGSVSLVAHAALPEYQAAADNLAVLVWSFAIAALVGKFLANLKAMFPEAPIPLVLTDKPRVPPQP